MALDSQEVRRQRRFGGARTRRIEGHEVGHAGRIARQQQHVVGQVGGVAWLPFLVAFAVATLTAYSYLELVCKYPQAAGAALYWWGYTQGRSAERVSIAPVVSDRLAGLVVTGTWR